MMTLPSIRRRHRPLPRRDQWEALRRDAFARSGGRCQCVDCGRHAGQCTARLHDGPGGYQVDHIIPRNPADPSLPQGTDDPDNLRAVCKDCNGYAGKGNRITRLPEGPARRAIVTLAIAARLHDPRVGVPVGYMHAIRAPHMVTYRLELPVGLAKLPTNVPAEVLAALHALGQSPAGVRVAAEAGVLSIEVPIIPAPPVPLRSAPSRGLAVGVGVTSANQRTAIDFGESPHVLVSGATGSGKSKLLQVIARGLALAGVRLILVDSDADTWAPFARCAALACAVAETPKDIEAAVRLAHRTMVARRGAPGPHDRLALIVDEAQAIDAASMGLVREIAAGGRKFGVHLILGTQHNVAKYIERGASLNCGWRIAGRTMDAAASKAALGVAGGGAESLTGAGDMILAHGGRLTRFRACLPAAADFAELPQAAGKVQPAPREDRNDPRYQRKPTDAQVRHLVERHAETGRKPSANEVKRTFGGGTRAAQRARDEALQLVGAGI